MIKGFFIPFELISAQNIYNHVGLLVESKNLELKNEGTIWDRER